MRLRDDFIGSCGRALRRCVAGLPVLPAAAVLASRGILRAGWHGTGGPDTAGYAGRVVAHAGQAAAFRCGSMPASLGTALCGHRHRRPARVPVPRLAVRARRRGGRDPAAGGGGAAAPVGVLAGAARGRGVRHGLGLPGAAAASSDPGHPRVRRLPVRPHRDRSDPLPHQRRRNHRQQTPTPPTSHSSTRGSFGAEQDPRVPVGSVQRTSFGISISYGEMPVARTPTSAAAGHQALGDRDVAALRAGGADALLRRQHPHPGSRGAARCRTASPTST